MDPNDARRSGGKHTLHCSGIEIVRLGVDIGEDWCDALPLQRVRCSDEGHGRHDHLARHTEGPNRNFERDRGVALSVG